MLGDRWPLDDHGNLVVRWLATKHLRFAEVLFLLAYGWRRERSGLWRPPAGHPKVDHGDAYDRQHAVNSTRYYLGGRWTKQGRRRTGG